MSTFAKCKIGKNSQIDTGNVHPALLRRIAIVIGDDCHVVFQEIRVLNSMVSIYMNNNAKIKFGPGQAFNGICNFHLHEPSKIIVGSNCLWSNGTVTTSDYHSIVDASSGLRINASQDVIIGDRVWCGLDFLILKGVQIGHDSVLAAKSVLTRGSYPTNVILAGNPAKVVKTDITWDHSFL